MPGWNHVPVRDQLSQQLGCPVTVDNDASRRSLINDLSSCCSRVRMRYTGTFESIWLTAVFTWLRPVACSCDDWAISETRLSIWATRNAGIAFVALPEEISDPWSTLRTVTMPAKGARSVW